MPDTPAVSPRIPGAALAVSGPEDVRAAGAVVRRNGAVLVVHRPAYDDWSFPKGKTDPGEHPLSAAVREVEEETTLRIRLGPALPFQRYGVKKGTKRVDFWQAQVRGSASLTAFTPNSEIDRVAWMPYARARELLTYERDVQLLELSLGLPRTSCPLIIVRHAAACQRKDWGAQSDTLRPLLDDGAAEAGRLVPLLGAYGVRQLISSDSTRCVRTLQPYARSGGLPAQLEPGLSEGGATRDGVAQIVQSALTAETPTALCSHRPVLPWIFAAVGLEPVALQPGEFVVVHRRRGEVVGLERHRACS